MKTIIGVLLIVLGIIAGIYFGLWWAFVGGIISVIEQVRAPQIDATAVALAIVRIVFAGLIGWASALLLIVPGAALASSKK